jgi:hypothetical protein
MTDSLRYVHAEDVKIGDVLIVLGTERTVTRIETYDGTLAGPGWRVAHSGPSWSFSLIPGQSVWVAPTEPESGTT